MSTSDSLPTVRRLIAYNRSVFLRFERSLERRSWKEATADEGTGHLSMKNTLVHILNVEEAWFVAVAQGRWEIFDRKGRQPKEIGSWKELRAYRDHVWAETDAFLATVSEKSLRGRLKAPWMPGRYTLEDACFQVTIEQAHHLGEVIAVYWQHDRSPPAMTWIENLPQNVKRPKRTGARR
jgi:uncharacterized damage-inducible protein DinB